jgi:hypothetical protein
MNDKFFMKVGQATVVSFVILLVVAWLIICYQIGYGR